jgi:biotin carboxyl carrier protein
MKMENEITARRSGTVTGLSVKAGEPVRSGQVICVVSADGTTTAGPASVA